MPSREEPFHPPERCPEPQREGNGEVSDQWGEVLGGKGNKFPHRFFSAVSCRFSFDNLCLVNILLTRS